MKNLETVQSLVTLQSSHMNAGSVKTLAHADLVFFLKCYLASRFKKHPGHSPSMGQTGKKRGGRGEV